MRYSDEIVLGETRVIVKPEYRSMAKNFWLYQEKWRDQNETHGECLVIGGEYVAWRVLNGVFYLQDGYQKYEAPNTVGIHDLALADEVIQCSFSVGDAVRPNKEFDFASFESELPSYFNEYFRRAGNGNHKVTGVLNKYFIFIDVLPFSDYSLPFYCGDFEFADKQIGMGNIGKT